MQNKRRRNRLEWSEHVEIGLKLKKMQREFVKLIGLLAVCDLLNGDHE